MFKMLANVFVVIALIAVTGGHWALLQTVAWTNMLATNLQSGSFEVAVAKTFDGQHPCGLCKMISAGKQSEKKSELPSPVKKLEFVSARTVFIFSAPQDFWRAGDAVPAVTPFSTSPPVPPPRSLHG